MIGIERSAGIGFDPPCRLVAVQDRHLNIHQDKVGPLFRYRSKSFLAIFSFGDLIIGGGKHIANNLAIVLLVLHHQNAFAHGVWTCCSTWTGSVIENVEPLPS